MTFLHSVELREVLYLSVLAGVFAYLWWAFAGYQLPRIPGFWY